jgi:hypothetical protein
MINQAITPLSKTIVSMTIASAMLMGSGGNDPVQASVQFQSPNDIPPHTTGGGVRGQIQFTAPGEDTPVSNTTGGGVRGNVQFALPGEATPKRVVGGGVRGNVNFSAPGENAPNGNSNVGGGVRGNVNFSAPGENAPQGNSNVGGGVRGNVNFSAPGENAPQGNSNVGGGVRGEELAKVIPLMPKTNYGRTISGRPTFLVYLPPTASQEVFFSLQDANRNHHYQTTFSISGQGGIVELTLPEDAPELEMGKEYVWFLAPIAPDGILRPDNYGVTGWVKRVDAPIARQEQSSLNPIELATLYAKEGIWYDTLQVLSAAKLAQPDDATLASEWKDLLEQVELEAIASEPINEQL